MITQNAITAGLLLFCGAALWIYVVAGSPPGSALLYGGAAGLSLALIWCQARARWWRGMSLRRRASLVFHLSLLGMIACGVLESVSGYRGVMLLAEGQSRLEEERGYLWLKREGVLTATSGCVVTLLRLEHGEKPAALVEVMDAEGLKRSGLVSVNQPMGFFGRSLHLARYGYSPRLVVKRRDGGEIFDSCLSLNYRVRDTVSAEDFPRLVKKGGTPLSRRVRVEVAATPEGTTAAEAEELPLVLWLGEDGDQLVELPPGGSVSLDGYVYSFPELRYWIQLRVNRQPFYMPLMLFISVGLTALAVRYMPLATARR